MAVRPRSNTVVDIQLASRPRVHELRWHGRAPKATYRQADPERMQSTKPVKLTKRGTRPLRRPLVLGLLLTLAGILALQLTGVGREWTVPSWVRLERLWARDFPVASLRGLLRYGDPVLGAVGLLRPVRVEVEPGVSLLLDPFDDVGRTILTSRTGSWEPGVWSAISRALGTGAVFLDVGAHIGYDSLTAARLVGETGLVVAFEPNPTTVAELRANVTASRATNVNVQAIALADAEHQLTLFDARRSGNSGSSSLSSKNAGDAGTPYTVQGRRLDAVVRELNLRRVDAIKADVEGAEVLVLSGATETLARFHPALVLEVVPEQLANMGTSVDALESLLRAQGYGRSRWIDYKNKEYLFGQ